MRRLLALLLLLPLLALAQVTTNPGATGVPAPQSAVAITGGTINSTPIGATTPSTGAFTTITGTSLQTTGPIATMKQSGTTTKGSSVGEVFPFTPGASKSFGIQMGNINGGGLAVLSMSVDGAGGVFYFEYKSGTVTKLAGDANLVIGASATASQVAVGKSANSATLTITTGSGVTGGVAVMILGQTVTGTTDPI